MVGGNSGGAKQITIGIKIGTDLTPFVNKIKELKTAIASLGESKNIINGLKSATVEWANAIKLVNDGLGVTAEKLRALSGSNPFQGGAAVNVQLPPIQGGSGAAYAKPPSGVLSKTYPLPVKHFSTEHQIMLARATSLAARVNPRRGEDISTLPSYMRASELSALLTNKMVIPQGRITAQTDLAHNQRLMQATIQSPGWLANYMKSSGKGIEDAQIEQQARIAGARQRERLAATTAQYMQKGNERIKTLHEKLQQKYYDNETDLGRRNETSQKGMRAQAGMLMRADSMNVRFDNAPQLAGMKAAGVLQAAYNANTRFDNNVQKSGQANLRIHRMGIEEDERRSEAPHKAGTAYARQWGAAYRERGTRQRAAQTAGTSILKAESAAYDESHARLYEPWREEFNKRLSRTTELTSELRSARSAGGLSGAQRMAGTTALTGMTAERARYATIRDGGTVKGLEWMSSKEAIAALSASSSSVKGMSAALAEARAAADKTGKSFGSTLKQVIGFGTGVAAVRTVIGAMRQLYTVALDVDKAFANVRSAVTKIADMQERKAAFKSITQGMLEDSKRTGLSMMDTSNIHNAVYFGSSGTREDRSALAKTLTNMHLTGTLKTDETLATLPALQNAGFSAIESRGMFEQLNAVGGMMRLDPQRMRAMLAATTANLPSMGNTASFEDIKAWALQEAAGSRDMIMGSKLNRIQIGLQNPKTMQRLGEILTRRQTRMTIGGEDMTSILNNGSPMKTLGKIQSLYEQGHITEGEITQVGQTIDMWNSPGTIQMLKGGLNPYKKMMRDAETLTKSGLISTDEAAFEHTNSLVGSTDKLGASLKAFLIQLAPAGDGIKGFINGLAGLINSIAAHGNAIAVVTKLVMGLIGTISASKMIQGAGAIPGMLGDIASKGSFKEWGKLGLGALGGVTGLLGGAVITAGVMGLNAYEDSVNEKSAARSENSRVAATRSALKSSDSIEDYYSLSGIAGSYKKMVESGKGGSDAALRLKEKIIALLPIQANGEAATLNILKGQTSELDKQVKAKAEMTQDGLRGKVENLARKIGVGLMYARGATYNIGNAMNDIQPAVAAAARDKDPEIRAWAENSRKRWGSMTGDSDYGKGLAALEMIEQYKKLLETRHGMSLGRNDATGKLYQDLGAAAGTQTAEQEWHWYKKNGMDGFHKTNTGDWASLLTAESQQRVIGYNENPDDEVFLRGLAAEMGSSASSGGKVGISTSEGARRIEARLKTTKDPKAFTKLRDRIVGELDAAGVGAVGKMNRTVGIYNTRIPGEAKDLANNTGSRKDLMGNGGEYLDQRDTLLSAWKMADPQDKSVGVTVNMDKGKDPKALLKLVQQNAKAFAQGGDPQGLAELLSNPAFSPEALEKMIVLQDAQITEDLRRAAGSPPDEQNGVLQLHFASMKADRIMNKAFFNKGNLKKLYGAATTSMLKLGSFDDTGELLMKGDAELAEDALKELGPMPTDAAGIELYQLKHAHLTAKKKREQTQGALKARMQTASESLGINAGHRDLMLEGSDQAATLALQKERHAEDVARIAIVSKRADQAYNKSIESFSGAKLGADIRGLFNTGGDQQKDLTALLGMEIKAEQEKLNIQIEERALLTEQIATRKRINELTFKQLLTMEQVQRAVVSTKEGRAFSASVVAELYGGDASQRFGNLNKLAVNTIQKGLVTNMTGMFESLDKAGGPGNPLSAMGRMLYDPTGEVANQQIQKTLLSATEQNTQATQMNTATMAALNSTLQGNPTASPSGTGVSAGSGSLSMTGTSGSYSSQGFLNGANNGNNPMGVSSYMGLGAVMGMSAAGVIAGSTGKNTLGWGLTGAVAGAGMGALMGMGAQSAVGSSTYRMSTQYGDQMFSARYNTVNVGAGMEGMGITPVTDEEGNLTGYTDAQGNFVRPNESGAARSLSQIGMSTSGVNFFSKTNDVDGKNVRGGLYKANGDISWGSAAGGAAAIGMSAYAGYASQKGNGQAAQNYQAVAGGLGAASAMAGGPMTLPGAALMVASVAATMLASQAAGKNKSEEAEKAFARQQSDMEKMLAIAEEQRKSLGLAAERILSSRADVGNAFQGVAASAFLSGRYAQSAPTIKVEQLIVQANNPSELSAALAQGISKEMRRGA